MAHSEETKRKIGLARLGKKRKPFTDETRARISAGSKGKPKSEEHKAAMAAAQRARRARELLG